MSNTPERKLRDAILRKDFNEAQRLIDSGANLLIPDENDLNALDYAQLSGNIDFFKYVFQKNRENNVQLITDNYQKIRQQFSYIPDFYMKFKWQLRTWIPFVTKHLPKDDWTLIKVGHRLRIDTNLAWSGFAFAKGNVSIFFDASKENVHDAFIAIDTKTGKEVSLFHEILSPLHINNDIDNILKMNLLKGKSDNNPLNKAKAFIKEKVNDISHSETVEKIRSRMTSVKIKFTKGVKTLFSKEKSPSTGNILEKIYHGQFLCSSDFPLQPYTLIPFLELLAPSNDVTTNIFEILKTFQDGKVEGEIAVFPTLKVQFEFYDFNFDVRPFVNKVSADFFKNTK